MCASMKATVYGFAVPTAVGTFFARRVKAEWVLRSPCLSRPVANKPAASVLSVLETASGCGAHCLARSANRFRRSGEMRKPRNPLPAPLPLAAIFDHDSRYRQVWRLN